MAKRKIEAKTKNYGIYTRWDRDSNLLPQILEFTKVVPAVEDIEFGYIINIRGARGKTLEFTIEHPPIEGEDGELLPVFEGSEHVTSNDYYFYLGDCIWKPVEEKCGIWTMSVSCCGKKLESISFKVVPSDDTRSAF